MKADDDVYIRLNPLAKSVEPLPRVDLYYGFVIPCNSQNPYSEYMSGMGYLISWDLVEWISTSNILKLDLRISCSNGKCSHELIPQTIEVHRLKSKWSICIDDFPLLSGAEAAWENSVNGDFATKESSGAVGVVVWDASSGILVLFAAKIPFLSVILGELVAVCKGVEVLRSLGIEEADILSDCLSLVPALYSVVAPHWNVSFLFSKVLSLLTSLSAKFFWIPRSKNHSAHALTKWGLDHSCKGFLNFWEVSPHVLTSIFSSFE
ncbi:hypothetical protein F8388_001558 [Cannabis sativa]|uniref:RNase H type-1 domain-containing protein n=1 Tax=Cannabis sativa TaxID=3483 RepID=A0A7J6HJL8_CANSA|nr:hypothetical protein F8388_001558 [Cannabis sativa]